MNGKRLRLTLHCIAAAIAATGVARPASAGNGTVPGYGLGDQTIQYQQNGSPNTKVDWPYGLTPILHLRTFYFDADTLTDTRQEAWAIGGWAGLRTGFISDVFQVGVTGYTSQKLYGPEDRDGTKLLRTGQEQITVLGEAYGAVKFLDQTFIGYRQLVNRPFIDQNDTRMVPHVFEGYTLRGAPDGWQYMVGYLTKVKVRDSDQFKWFSQQAGAANSQEGMIIAGVTIPFLKSGFVRLDEQYVKDTFNTVYIDGLYPIPYDQDTTFAVGAQYYPQDAVSGKQLGDFKTWGAGVTGLMTWRELTLQLAYAQTGNEHDTLNPWGDHVSYLNLMQVAFNTAGEQGWLVGAAYDFGKLVTPGLTGIVNYAQGSSRRDFTTGDGLPNRNETNIRLDYAFPKGHVLEGFSATFRYSWLHQDGGSPTATQLRAYLNYEIPFR